MRFACRLLLLTCLAQPVWSSPAPLPVKSAASLPAPIKESSGLARVGQDWISHNDSGDEPRLFRFAADGRSPQEYRVEGAKAVDWEAAASNGHWLFLADTGNNFGFRRDLRIYRIPVAQFRNPRRRSLQVDKVYPIAYAEQHSFLPTLNATAFDMEAMAVVKEELWLLSKDWQQPRHSRLYRLPIAGNGGTLTAVQTLKTGCLITGADYDPQGQRMAMVGYLKGKKKAPPCLWVVPVGQNRLLMEQGIRYELARKGQFEAVAWETAHTLLLTREGQPTLYRVRLPAPHQDQ